MVKLIIDRMPATVDHLAWSVKGSAALTDLLNLRFGVNLRSVADPNPDLTAARAALEVYAGKIVDEGETLEPETVNSANSTPPAEKVRSVSGALELYRGALTDIAERAATAKSLKGPMNDMRSLIRGMAEQAYAEGMREGGIENAEEEMDDSDREAIKSWVAGQLPYVQPFLSDVHEAGPGDMDTLNRIEMWVQSLETLAGMGTMSAQSNMMVTWQYGDTEHCDTCKKLNGQRHRMKWFTDKGYIPREPGSETLDCGGWRCQCGLFNDDGEQIV